MNTDSRSGRRSRRSIMLLTLYLAVLTAAFGQSESFLWITSDLEGYLVGCECPSGFSAGISAVLPALADRNGATEALIDLGGFREPERRDELLETYLDRAASRLGYTVMVGSAADLRDGRKAFHNRVRELPLTSAGGVHDRRILSRLEGEREVTVFETGLLQVGLAVANGAGEADRLADGSGGRFEAVGIPDVLSLLSGSPADFRILAFRGHPDELSGSEIPAGGALPDLVVFTGTDSPAYELPTGGLKGILELGGKAVPWVSGAPRGNSLLRIGIGADSDPDIGIVGLERGISPESTEILALGEAFMEDLVNAALAAAGRPRTADGGNSTETGTSPAINAEYWYPYGCRDCDDFLWNTVPEIENEYRRSIEIKEWNSSDPEDFDVLRARLDNLGVALQGMPVMIIDGRVFQGDDDIRTGLIGIASGHNPDSGASGNRGTGSDGKAVRWEPGAIFLAGLLDGVNPCAFSAMVFLVSALALAGRSKRTMLAIGLFYAAGVFFTYSLIGAGLLGGLRRIAVESNLRVILENILVAILLVLAVLSLIDGIRLRRGRHDLLLKLPDRLSRRLHGIIRDSVRSGAAAGAALLLGGAVALIELGCTGQVYLPTIAWMISRGDGGTPWLWLLIYNSAFIIPLLIVFVVSYRGVTAVRLAGAFRRRGAMVKFATAILFLILALVMLLG